MDIGGLKHFLQLKDLRIMFGLLKNLILIYLLLFLVLNILIFIGRRHWRNIVLPDSRVTIKWDTKQDSKVGVYRIRHFGFAKKSTISGTLTPYTGTTKTFTLLH